MSEEGEMGELVKSLDKKEDSEGEAHERSSHAAGNKSIHNSIFTRWLVSTFGQNDLRNGGGVVDIAGGLGLISFELAVRYGVQSTVIEPRDIALKAITRRMGKKVTRNRRRKALSTSCEAAEKPSNKRQKIEAEEDHHGSKDKKGLESFIESLIPLNDDCIVLDGIDDALTNYQVPFTHLKTCFAWPLGTNKGAIYSSVVSSGKGDNLCTVPVASVDSTALVSALESASLLTGMHSDQATEAIVDAALALNKPFAVVPCCVFKKENPHRRLMGEKGQEVVVSSYSELLRYLQAKDKDIRRANLPFLGRNVVLYRL